MDDALIPDWIKDIKNQDGLQKAQSEAAERSEVVASLVVNSDGPRFWKQLLKELQINVNGLQQIGFRASLTISDKDMLDSKKKSCHIEVARESPIPNQTYINLHYSTRVPSKITCSPMDGEAYRLTFCVQNGRVAVLLGNDVLNEEETAQHIVQSLVNLNG